MGGNAFVGQLMQAAGAQAPMGALLAGAAAANQAGQVTWQANDMVKKSKEIYAGNLPWSTDNDQLQVRRPNAKCIKILLARAKNHEFFSAMPKSTDS